MAKKLMLAEMAHFNLDLGLIVNENVAYYICILFDVCLIIS